MGDDDADFASGCFLRRSHRLHLEAVSDGRLYISPGHCFPPSVFLPFTVIATESAALLSRLAGKWPAYPKPLTDGRDSLLRTDDGTCGGRLGSRTKWRASAIVFLVVLAIGPTRNEFSNSPRFLRLVNGRGRRVYGPQFGRSPSNHYDMTVAVLKSWNMSPFAFCASYPLDVRSWRAIGLSCWLQRVGLASRKINLRRLLLLLSRISK